MKNLTLLVACLLISWSAMQAQEVIYAQKLTREKVPGTVLKSLEKDFPDAKITDYASIPTEKIGEELIINPSSSSENYDMYEMHVTGKNFNGDALYDRNGNLVRSTEIVRNVPLPYHVQRAIGENYPGWAVTNDREVMTFYKKGMQKVYYRVHLTKGKEKANIILDAEGNLSDLQHLNS